MKKWLALILVLAAICVAMTACNKSTDVDAANVFPVSTNEDSLDVTMGDVMPFYDNGVMNIYHLRNSSGNNPNFYHPIARLTTVDFIHYTDEGIALSYANEKDPDAIKSVDAALGTGSFIKDNNGLYHCFYTGHNDKGIEEGLPHVEVIRHATSPDQKEWTKIEEFKLYGHENDFRDPYVYWDSVDNCYYMLVTTRDNMSGGSPAVIRRYTATSLDATSDEWTFLDNFFINDAGDFNMECPSYIELNGFYYLAYSEQGNNRVTHYRYKTSHDDPEWHKFERDSIDASGFYAGRLEKAGEKLYAFAWCARLAGGTTGGFDWGGNLVTHELVQKENGELCAVMPQNYKEYFTHKASYKSVDGKDLSEYAFEEDKFVAFGVDELKDKVTRMSFTVTIVGDKGNFGLSFGLDGAFNNRLGSAVMAFDLENNCVSCYNNVSNKLRYGSPLASVRYNFEQGKSYAVDVIIDGEVLSVYLGGDIAITARITDMKESNFAFYSNGAGAQIKDIAIYE